MNKFFNEAGSQSSLGFGSSPGNENISILIKRL